MNGRRGTVWHDDRPVGALREDEHLVLHFAYDGAWLDGGGFPVSVHLPLFHGEEEVAAHTFFAGLLPEGGTRQRVCRQRGITFEDDTGLLFAIGEDCAGALSVMPADVEPDIRPAPPETLTQAQIDGLVRSVGEEAATLIGDRQRFSLAGTQEKQPVVFDGESYALPDRTNPSSHLLKFETVRWVCVAECIANDIARRVGLPVVGTEFLRAGADDGVPFLRIERYDRARGAEGRLTRLHQEDLLQALGLSAALKYQRDGGPSLGDVAELLRTHAARPAETTGSKKPSAAAAAGRWNRSVFADSQRPSGSAVPIRPPTTCISPPRPVYRWPRFSHQSLTPVSSSSTERAVRLRSHTWPTS